MQKFTSSIVVSEANRDRNICRYFGIAFSCLGRTNSLFRCSEEFVLCRAEDEVLENKVDVLDEGTVDGAGENDVDVLEENKVVILGLFAFVE